MLLRGNPSLPPAAGRFVLQDAPVPKHPTARIAPWISRGTSSPLGNRASWIPWERITRRYGIPARKIPYLYRPPPARLPPFRRAAVRVPPASRSYFSPRSYRASVQFTARETVVLRLPEDPRGAGMPRNGVKTAHESACWKPAARRKYLSIDLNYNSTHMYRTNQR